jgi:apolipoprotein N-acyltransferase
VSLEFRADSLVLLQRWRRFEIPYPSIEGVIPWRFPLPPFGVWLRLKSGRRFPYGLVLARPAAFIEALADAGAPEQIRAAASGFAVQYGQARRGAAPRWCPPGVGFPLFALVPTLPVFRLHQWIAYGGTFGEYYSYGLEAYLLAFAIYWATFTIYLVLYAAALRVLSESIAFVATAIDPSRMIRVRYATELARRVLYVGGVFLFLVRLYALS